MDDQRTDREGGGSLKQGLPRFTIKSLLIAFAILATWLWSARLDDHSGGDDVRKALLLLLVVGAGSLAIYSTGNRRAYWSGFTFSLFMIASGWNGFILDFRWLDQATKRFGTFRPPDNGLPSELYWNGRLACVMLLCSIAGFVAAHIYDRSRREK
jgi:hypothetical protein